VATLRVVEHFDIVEHILPGFFPAVVDLAPDPLALEQLEKALRDSVVVAASATAHACPQVVSLQEILPVVAAELAALIRMHSHRFLWLSLTCYPI